MPLDTTQLTQMGMNFWKWAVYGIFIFVFFAGVYGLAFWFNRSKRYKYRVRIFNRDSIGNIIQQPDDRGGIFLDKKTNFRLFLLRKNKFGLDPDEIPYLISFRRGLLGFGLKTENIVHILQTGLKNFQFLKPQLSENPGIVFNVQDEDVAWAINAYERHKKAFQQTLLQQVMPIIGMAFVFMMVVVALYFIFKNFGTLSDTAAALKESAQAFTEAVKIQHLGTVVE
jgi:hypothetical protein